jgi:hypothetical protein
MRHIEIEWFNLAPGAPSKKVVAALEEEKNPSLCDLLWGRLPYSSIQHHALISGQHLYHYNPIVESFFAEAKAKESRSRSPDGTVFLSYLQHLSVKYGFLTEDLPAAPVARVLPECLDDLRAVGKACWASTFQDKNLVEVRVSRRGEPFDGAYRLPPPGPLASPSARQLAADLHDETQRIWMRPPAELVDLFAGRIASGAGAYNQYFSTLVFVNGEERALAYNALGGLLKSCRRSDISLETLRQITPNFVLVPAEFLGYCGLETLAGFVARFVAALGELESKDEYTSLLSALTMYANKLNGWSLHYFPWVYGRDHLYSTPLAEQPLGPLLAAE